MSDTDKIIRNKEKKLILLPHCVLNPFSIIHGCQNNQTLAMEMITMAMKHDIGIIQLPCPEMTLLGAKRWAQSFEQYDTPWFHQHCEKLAAFVVAQVENHNSDGVKLMATVGIAGSPSCAIFETTSADYAGLVPGMNDAPEALPKSTKVPRQGHFIHILQKQLHQANLHFNLIELPRRACDAEKRKSFISNIEQLIKN